MPNAKDPLTASHNNQDLKLLDISVVLTTRAFAGVGLVASTLALGFAADGIGALNVVVPIDDEDMKNIPAADNTLSDLGGNFYSLFVFDCCWCKCHMTYPSALLCFCQLEFKGDNVIFLGLC